jgi:hypothetical protein
MRKLGMAALALVLSGWAGTVSAQPWYWDDDPYPRRWGYERDYGYGWDGPRRYDGPRNRYERDWRSERRYVPRRDRVDRGRRGHHRRTVHPSTRPGNCYAAPARPHASPRVICRY